LSIWAASNRDHAAGCRVVPAHGWDVPGAIVLFAGLLCLIGPLLFGHDVHWAPWVLARHGNGCCHRCSVPSARTRRRKPRVECPDRPALLSDAAFMRGLTPSSVSFLPTCRSIW